jgi:hypothetical protein
MSAEPSRTRREQAVIDFLHLLTVPDCRVPKSLHSADIDSGELIAAPLPQVLLMHDASDGSQVRP